MDTQDQAATKLLSHLQEIDLRLDREGRWFHEGDPVTHEGLAAALHRWIDRDDETGRYIVRSSDQWCFIEVEDAPFIVRAVTLEGQGRDQRVQLRLSNGTVEELDYATLRQAPDNVLYATVKEGRFPARFSRSAYYRLAETMELDGDEPKLPAKGALWSIAPVER